MWIFIRDNLASIAFLAMLIIVLMIIQKGYVVLDKYFLYFPSDELTLTPVDVGLKYENVYLTTADGVELHGWFIPGETETVLTLFHGNAGNISDRLDYLNLMHTHLGVSIFIFDYRGYGLSQGSPSESGLYLDAEAAVEFIRDKVESEEGPQNLLLFGRSLGSALALKMASKYVVDGVIVEAPFTSTMALAKTHYPYVPEFLVKLFIRARYESDTVAGTLNSPLMVIHGSNDSIVPIEMGEKIYDLADVKKSFYSVDGADHNNTYVIAGENYFKNIRDAIQGFMENP